MSAVNKISRDWVGTHDKGLIFKPIEAPDLEVYPDSSFGGDGKRETAADDPATEDYASGLSIDLSIKLHTEVALSLTKCE